MKNDIEVVSAEEFRLDGMVVTTSNGALFEVVEPPWWRLDRRAGWVLRRLWDRFACRFRPTRVPATGLLTATRYGGPPTVVRTLRIEGRAKR